MSTAAAGSGFSYETVVAKVIPEDVSNLETGAVWEISSQF